MAVAVRSSERVGVEDLALQLTLGLGEEGDDDAVVLLELQGPGVGGAVVGEDLEVLQRAGNSCNGGEVER